MDSIYYMLIEQIIYNLITGNIILLVFCDPES